MFHKNVGQEIFNLDEISKQETINKTNLIIIPDKTYKNTEEIRQLVSFYQKNSDAFATIANNLRGDSQIRSPQNDFGSYVIVNNAILDDIIPD